MKRIPVLTMLTVLFGLWTMAVFAAVPQLINFQGVVKDSAGNTPAVDMLGLTFTIYDAPLGGAALWTESQSVTIVAGGLFSVLLGASSPIPDSVFADSSRWLGIKVETDPEMLPRQRLVAVGYAYRVGTVDGATGGVISGDVSIQSNLAVDGAMNAKNMVLLDPGPINTPLSIQGSAGQSADLLKIMDASGAPLITVGSGGAMDAKNLVLQNPGPASTPLVIEGSMGQTANLMEFRIPMVGGGFSTPMSIGPNGDPRTGPLQVDGSIALNLTTVTDCGLPVTLDKYNGIVVYTGPVTPPDTVCTLNLPTAAGIKGRQYTIKRARILSSPQVAIYPFGSEKIENSSVMYLATPGNYVTIVSDGSNWHIIASGNSP